MNLGYGKSTLLSRLMHDPNTAAWEMKSGYEPTTFNSSTQFWKYRQHQIQVDLYDTAGQEAFASLRQLAYPGAVAFIFAYDAGNRASFANLKEKWLPEVPNPATNPNPNAVNQPRVGRLSNPRSV